MLGMTGSMRWLAARGGRGRFELEWPTWWSECRKAQRCPNSSKSSACQCRAALINRDPHRGEVQALREAEKEGELECDEIIQ